MSEINDTFGFRATMKGLLSNLSAPEITNNCLKKILRIVDVFVISSESETQLMIDCGLIANAYKLLKFSVC